MTADSEAFGELCFSRQLRAHREHASDDVGTQMLDQLAVQRLARRRRALQQRAPPPGFRRCTCNLRGFLCYRHGGDSTSCRGRKTFRRGMDPAARRLAIYTSALWPDNMFVQLISNNTNALTRAG